jgi:hypothetical protein
MTASFPRGRFQVVAGVLASVILFLLLSGLSGVISTLGSRSRGGADSGLPLRAGLDPGERMTAYLDEGDLPKALRMYAELTGRDLVPSRRSLAQRLDRFLDGRLVRWKWVLPPAPTDSGICYHRDGRFAAIEVKQQVEACFRAAGVRALSQGKRQFLVVAVDSGVK